MYAIKLFLSVHAKKLFKYPHAIPAKAFPALLYAQLLLILVLNKDTITATTHALWEIILDADMNLYVSKKYMKNADLNVSKIAVKNKISVDQNPFASSVNYQNLCVNAYSIKLEMDNMLILMAIKIFWRDLRKSIQILNMEALSFLTAKFASNYLNIVNAHLKNSANHNANSVIN